MARYIDKQELIKFLDERGYFKHAIYRSVIEDFPSADVVPKSEVEKWFRECEVLQGRFIELEKEVAREIADFIWEKDIASTLFPINGRYLSKQEFIEHFEKKYTESEDNGGI